ncbi:MAG TPA: hypothetical protein V6D17_17185, partial [Candidatus Obscuribacterales bacterium]
MADEEQAKKEPSAEKAGSPLADAEEGGPELVVKDGDRKAEDKAAAKSAQLEKASAPVKSAPPVTPTGKESGGLAQRRSRWESSSAALRYISSLSRDDEVRVRDSDRATTIFLLLSSILTVLSLVVKPFAGMRLQLVLICDLLVGVMLIFYLANRFGIVNTLTPRQALLTWQLMMGSAFLGIFMTINMA